LSLHKKLKQIIPLLKRIKTIQETAKIKIMLNTGKYTEKVLLKSENKERDLTEEYEKCKLKGKINPYVDLN
jgi:hypothetical protein